MAAIAVFVESRSALLALRRTLPNRDARVIPCRTPARLGRVMASQLVDAVVVSPTAAQIEALARLRADFPRLPIIAYAAFRPDDGELLVACLDLALTAVAVEGVDDAVVGDVVARHSLTAERRAALRDAPRLLRLTEPLQLAAWDTLVADVEHPVRTGTLARRLKVSREHLSRQFGAGGAPNLKRVIDLTRVTCAAQLLQNPGLGTAAVVDILHFASTSHLSSTARRIANVPASALAELGARGVLAGFVRGNTRSRV